MSKLNQSTWNASVEYVENRVPLIVEDLVPSIVSQEIDDNMERIIQEYDLSQQVQFKVPLDDCYTNQEYSVDITMAYPDYDLTTSAFSWCLCAAQRLGQRMWSEAWVHAPSDGNPVIRLYIDTDVKTPIPAGAYLMISLFAEVPVVSAI